MKHIDTKEEASDTTGLRPFKKTNGSSLNIEEPEKKFSFRKLKKNSTELSIVMDRYRNLNSFQPIGRFNSSIQ